MAILDVNWQGFAWSLRGVRVKPNKPGANIATSASAFDNSLVVKLDRLLN